MPEGEERRRAVGQHDLLHEGREVDVVLVEAADMAFAAVAQPALGQALAAPVQRCDCKSAGPQVADDLEILLYELGAARKMQTVPLRPRGGSQRA